MSFIRVVATRRLTSGRSTSQVAQRVGRASLRKCNRCRRFGPCALEGLQRLGQVVQCGADAGLPTWHVNIKILINVFKRMVLNSSQGISDLGTSWSLLQPTTAHLEGPCKLSLPSAPQTPQLALRVGTGLPHVYDCVCHYGCKDENRG